MKDLEQEGIITCIYSPEWRQKFLNSDIESSDFSNEVHRWIFKKFLPIAGDDVIDYDIFEKISEKDDSLKNNEEKLILHLEVGLKLFRTIAVRERDGEPVIYPNISKEFIHSIKRRSAIKSIMYDVVSRMENNESPEEIWKTFEENYSEARDTFNKSAEYEISMPLTDFEERTEKRREEIDIGRRIKFTDPALNQFFPLGLNESEILLICGDTGAGKSILSQNLLPITFLPPNGLNVLFVYAENEKAQSESRLDSIINDSDYTQIFTGELTKEKVKIVSQRYKRFVEDENTGQLFFVKLIPYRFTALTIEDIITEIELEHGIEIDVLVVDSPEHQIPIVKESQFFLRKAAVHYDLKALVSVRKLIGIFTVQRKADASLHSKKRRKGQVDDSLIPPIPEEAAGSVEIPRISDYMVIAMRPSRSDMVMGRSKLWQVKARNTRLCQYPILVYMSENSLKVSWEKFSPEQTSEDTNEEAIRDNDNGNGSFSSAKDKRYKISSDNPEEVEVLNAE